MPRQLWFAGFGLAFGLAVSATFCAAADPAPVRLVMSEVEAGSTQTQQYCAVVFADHRFHYERGSLHHGQYMDRRVYEGEFSVGDWNTLGEVLEAKDFRGLKVPIEVAPLVMQDSHVFTISVARDAHFQTMEFLDKKSLKPYQSQVKPLLEWWKSFRGRHLVESKSSVDARCTLDSEHTIFSQ